MLWFRSAAYALSSDGNLMSLWHVVVVVILVVGFGWVCGSDVALTGVFSGTSVLTARVVRRRRRHHLFPPSLFSETAQRCGICLG